MEYRITFCIPFYYLQVKKSWLIFTWWKDIEFSHDLEYLERLYMKKRQNNE